MNASETSRRHLLLGVTGGIASGKSKVAEMLQEKGALTIDFDQLAREVQEPGQPAYREIAAFFGDRILLEDGKLDRKRLSQIVFADPEKKAMLERFTHGPIIEAFRARFDSYIRERHDAIVQAIIPLLIEAKMQELFDRILLVYAPAALQLSRLVRRDHLSAEHAKRIIDAQLDIERKREHADFIIDNSGAIEDTRRQVDALWKNLKALRQ
jgi:dephospho-CoA kinase